MSRFVPAANIEDLAAQDVAPQLLATASEIAQRAAGNVPKRTGRYSRSLRAVRDDRGVVAESTDPFGHLVESGSINNPPYSPLRRAAADVAKRFEPQ